ncbi:hypothetical protein [Kitasatospora sp. GP82]|uniref:hypothetical protein n=1 Tax=Kitasatospora sp. GP82 TaxID=3035089 RepID=UPI0024758BDD|nr:hypothetical protein [Kitasatospora sp. GP82]MDH6130366.1 hypothetical protein [Kitasatospora sp. GP82]
MDRTEHEAAQAQPTPAQAPANPPAQPQQPTTAQLRDYAADLSGQITEHLSGGGQ